MPAANFLVSLCLQSDISWESIMIRKTCRFFLNLSTAMNAIAVTVETHERGSMFAEFWSVVRISEDRPKPATTNSAPVPPAALA